MILSRNELMGGVDNNQGWKKLDIHITGAGVIMRGLEIILDIMQVETRKIGGWEDKKIRK